MLVTVVIPAAGGDWPDTGKWINCQELCDGNNILAHDDETDGTRTATDGTDTARNAQNSD